MQNKRRSLVLTTESAGHPFRRSLPPHVCGDVAATAEKPRWYSVDLGDWRGFLTAYCATFVAVMIFIA